LELRLFNLTDVRVFLEINSFLTDFIEIFSLRFDLTLTLELRLISNFLEKFCKKTFLFQKIFFCAWVWFVLVPKVNLKSNRRENNSIKFYEKLNFFRIKVNYCLRLVFFKNFLKKLVLIGINWEIFSPIRFNVDIGTQTVQSHRRSSIF
jgi:hypothetical protein